MREQSRIPEQPPPAPPAPPPPAVRPRRRWLRWLVRGLLGLLLLVVLVVVGVVIYVQTPAGSARVLRFGLQAANEALAGKLSAGSLSIQGGHIVLRYVTLETPEGEKVAHVDLLEVRAALLPLIRKTVHLSVVRIEHPELWLTLDEEGTNLTRAIAARTRNRPARVLAPVFSALHATAAPARAFRAWLALTASQSSIRSAGSSGCRPVRSRTRSIR